MFYLPVSSVAKAFWAILIILSVDAHTAHHLYHECLRGDLMVGRTIVLVSHHVQLCAPDASYIVALDNGRVQFEGPKDAFYNSGVIGSLIQSTQTEAESQDNKGEKEMLETAQERILSEGPEPQSETSSTIVSTPSSIKLEKKPARKLVEEEKRAVGRIGRDIWETYIWACGNGWYWTLFIFFLIVASASPVLENGWLRCASYHLSSSPPFNSLSALGIGRILLSMEVGTVQFSIFRCMQSSRLSALSSGPSDGLSCIVVRSTLLMCSTNDFWSQSCSLIFDSMILFHEVVSWIDSERTSKASPTVRGFLGLLCASFLYQVSTAAFQITLARVSCLDFLRPQRLSPLALSEAFLSSLLLWSLV